MQVLLNDLSPLVITVYCALVADSDTRTGQLGLAGQVLRRLIARICPARLIETT